MANKISQRVAEERFKAEGCVLLGKYNGSDTLMAYTCSCGNRGEITMNRFTQGTRCCAAETTAARIRVKERKAAKKIAADKARIAFALNERKASVEDSVTTYDAIDKAGNKIPTKVIRTKGAEAILILQEQVEQLTCIAEENLKTISSLVHQIAVLQKVPEITTVPTSGKQIIINVG